MQVLQADEQEILKYVADEGGKCQQNEIVDSVPYSKAKVSTVLSDLEDRGIVERVKEGRTNTVSLVKTLEEQE
jgi:uncharacterized membrane protein